jgi:hypothetical protein
VRRLELAVRVLVADDAEADLVLQRLMEQAEGAQGVLEVEDGDVLADIADA